MSDDSGRPSGKWWHPLRILGQIAAILSILNLIKDLKWVSLQGLLASWVAAYNHLVLAVVHGLFGWIHVSWMQVSAPEAHLLVLGTLIGSAGIKAKVEYSFLASLFLPGWPSIVLAASVPLVFWSAAAAVVLLAPGWWGIGAAIAYVALMLRFAFGPNKSIREQYRLFLSYDYGNVNARYLGEAANLKVRQTALVNLGLAFSFVVAAVIASKILGP